jgi:hypothetical protein
MDRQRESHHEFMIAGQRKIIRVFSRAFAAKFLICAYLQKSAADPFLLVVLKESR